MFHVQMVTDHFVFDAYGETEEEANEAMGRAIDQHACQYGITFDWWEPYEFTTRELIAGTATRDGEPL